MTARKQSLSERAFFLLIYYLVWPVFFGYGGRFITARTTASDHISAWGLLEWFGLPIALASVVLLLAYLLYRVFATVSE